MLNLRTILWVNLLAVCCLMASTLPLRASVVDFEDLLPSEPYGGPGGGAYWRGPAADGVEEIGPWGDTLMVGTFSSGGVSFINRYSLDYGSWSGFGYSTTKDTQTAGFGNQFSAFAGRGAGRSATYAVAAGHVDDLDLSNEEHLRSLPSVSLPVGMSVSSVWVTNTTYAALSMRDGDPPPYSFGKKFGGATGEDPDWFKITAFGWDAAGMLLPGRAEFYLADYRADDPAQDYIVDQWVQWDLSVLAGAQRIYFNLSSSDRGEWGMNTPAFFALDDLHLVAVPEPSTLWLLAIGLFTLAPWLGRSRR